MLVDKTFFEKISVYPRINSWKFSNCDGSTCLDALCTKDKHIKKNIAANMESLAHSASKQVELYGTAKTHKFNNIQEMNKEKLKFRAIIDQTGTYSYNTAQVISQYLKPLCKNEFKINDTQSFAVDIKNIQPLQEDEEDVSYDVESLFTNIPINETIDYILDQIYNKKKLKAICSKLIFIRLLLKLVTEVTFTINNNFFKQTDGCTMGGPLSVILVTFS